MNQSSYKKIMDTLPQAYALHRMIYDENNNPVDYVFLYVNSSFERMTGLKREDILNQPITQVIPETLEDEFDWINTYAKVTKDKLSVHFKRYSSAIKKWFDITAYYTESDCFATIFFEVTEEVQEKKALHEMIKYVRSTLNKQSTSIDYQAIIDVVHKMSGLNFSTVIVVDEDVHESTLKAYATNLEKVKSISNMLGIQLIDSTWQMDVLHHPEFTNQAMTFHDFNLFSTSPMHQKIFQAATKLFRFSSYLIIKIQSEEKIHGAFIFVLEDSQAIENLDYIVLFANIIGEYFQRVQTSQLLRKTSEELQDFFDVSLDLLAIANTNGKLEKINKAWSDILGFSEQELLSKSFFDFIHPDDHPTSIEVVSDLHNQKEVKDYVNRLFTKDGNYKYIQWRTHPKGEQMYASGRDITTQKVHEEKLIEEHNQLLSIFDDMNALIYVIDMDNYNVLFINKSGKDTHGDIVGKKCYKFLYGESKSPCLHCRNQELLDTNERIEWEQYNPKTKTWYLANDSMITWPNGKQVKLHVSYDITDKKRMEEELFKEKEQLRTTLMAVSDAVISTDTLGRITMMNDVAVKMSGYTLNDAFLKPFEEVIQLVSEDDHKPLKNPVSVVLQSQQTTRINRPTLLLTKDMQHISVEDDATPIFDVNQRLTGVVVVLRDFSETRKRQKEVEYLSFHDHLTGLYNRRYFEDSLRRLNTRRNLPLSLIAIDLNGLKLTNDAYGHAMGDELIKHVSKILSNALRSDDILARTGGDEFMMILPNTTNQAAKEIRSRIFKFAKETTLESIIISLAIGIATKNNDEQSIEDTMKTADNNMYKNKLRRGRLMRSQTIEMLLRNLNQKYDREQIHAELVAQYCEAIARAMKLDESQIQELRVLGILHDIGKIIIPPEILNKKEKLSEQEWNQIKQHPVTGYNILKNVEEYSSLAEAVLHHHERIDGTGYPAGLKADEIPLYSRIISIADAYEAMTALRSYQNPKSKEEAIIELQACSNTQFDASIVDVFINDVLLTKPID